VGLRAITVGMDVGEADRVVNFKLVFCQIGSRGQPWEQLHAHRLSFFMLLWLSMLILLHLHEVFPLALPHLVLYDGFLFFEEAGTHEFTSF